jgi:gas vesicle protein
VIADSVFVASNEEHVLMGAFMRIVKFGAGGVVGAAIGAVAAVLTAPQSGRELQETIADRISRAKVAGAEAQAAKEQQLIAKFRAEVEDTDALRAEQAKTTLEAAETISAVGLSLNAPGALAAQETALRAADAANRD